MDSFMAMMAHSESFSTTDPSNLTDQELDCLKEAFSLFDADHDGEITVYELGKQMKDMYILTDIGFRAFEMMPWSGV